MGLAKTVTGPYNLQPVYNCHPWEESQLAVVERVLL